MKRADQSPSQTGPGAAARAFTMLLLIVAVVGLCSALVRSVVQPWRGSSATATAPAAATATAPPTQPAPLATATAPAAQAQRIGIVSGHRGNDSGAVCADGFTEAELNFMHAGAVAEIMRARGYQVDILDEFDPRLAGYRADVFLSIHADSCQPINELATGYKVARSRHSALPDVEDRLVNCLSENYARATGLRFHRNTVTANMLEYHGFYKIDAATPAAIIETGFMNLDRAVVQGRSADVARGIADGLVCFLSRRSE